MDLGLRGKTAIVAASSKGLGRACALSLSKEGVNVTIFSRNLDNIRRAAEEIQKESKHPILALQGDVTNPDDLKRIVKATIERFSSIHILVNNAGGPPPGNFLDLNEDDWKAAIGLNLYSTINLTKAVLPYMIKQKWGRIVNITSIAVKQPIDGLILSNTVRTGVIGLAKTLSNELAKYNILVNNVCPGRLLTDRIKELAQNRAEKEGKTVEEILKEMESDIPLGRIGDPSELASLVTFLSSERASYITGTTIQVDGGLVKSTF